jgi:acyl-CoA synthetase (AMP-forming)/AMP-acid ligase II
MTASPVSSLADAVTLGDVLRLNATTRPDKIAFSSPDGRSVSFGSFNDRVNRLNNAVAALGLRKGTRIAILSRNRQEYVESYGLSMSGLIIVPLNWRLSGAELGRLVADSEPELLIVDEFHRDLVDRHRDAWPSLKHAVLLGPGAADERWLSYEALIAAAPATEARSAASADDVLSLIYTSGTTGAPKGVTMTHAGVLGNCRSAAVEMLGLTEHDRTLAVMPLFHAGGMWYHLFPSFASGCTTFIGSGFEPGAVLRDLAAHRITNVHLVPTMINALLSHPDATTVNLSHLRLLFYAASSMPADLLRRVMRTFSRTSFTQSYGSTEAGVITVLNTHDHRRALEPGYAHLLSSCGRPLPGREVRIVDDAGSGIDRDRIGEIEVRSPDLMRGYWLNDTETQRASRDGWFKSGDLGYLDAEGFLYIVDRKNDLIITGGENVYPTEIEAYLYRDPDVLEAAVFGIPDPRWGEAVVAAVVPRAGSHISGGDLVTRLRAQLATFKCPKEIYLVQTLPKSAAGKILRKELRKQYTR